jgi:hypothetical protein
MTEELAVYKTQQVPAVDDVYRLGKTLAESGYFQDARAASQAIVKVLAGRELGIGPVASMTGIHLIQGKPAIGANLMAAAVKASRRYTYRIRTLTDESADIEFFERNGDAWESIGRSAFSIADARRAQTKNLDKFPRNMLFARAISNGVRWYCPDVFTMPVYNPDELGGNVNWETGEVIDVMPVAPDTGNGNQAQPATNGKPDKRARQPMDIERLKAAIQHKTTGYQAQYGDELASQSQRGLIVGKLEEIWAGDSDAENNRHTVLAYLTGNASAKLLSKAAAGALIDWLLDLPDDTGDYPINRAAAQEAHAIIRHTLEQAGQQTMFEEN